MNKQQKEWSVTTLNNSSTEIISIIFLTYSRQI